VKIHNGKKIFFYIFGVATVVMVISLWQRKDSPGELNPLPLEQVEDFALLDQDGRYHQLSHYSDASAIVLISYGIGCPTARKHLATIRQLQGQFAQQGVIFLLIDAQPSDNYSILQQETRQYHITCPILRDEAQVITQSLGMEQIPEVVVIRPKDGSIVYREVLDDHLIDEISSTMTARSNLSKVLEDLLDGEDIKIAHSNGKGCLINFPPSEEVFYVRDVAPILIQNCIGCHRAGGIGPFPMTDYHSIKGWAPMIREVIRTRRMPPWKFDGRYGPYIDHHVLKVEDVRRLIRWVDQGMVYGEGEEPLSKYQSLPAEEWSLGKPDLIVRAPVQYLPATGLLPDRLILLQPGLQEDVWLKAVVLRPGNRKVVHHAYVWPVWIDPNALGTMQSINKSMGWGASWKIADPDETRPVDGFLDVYGPGYNALTYPEGSGKLLPAGSSLVLGIHYVTTGRPEMDEFEIGLYFHHQKPAKKFITILIQDLNFEIPAGSAEHPISIRHLFKEGVKLHWVTPHMHYRGKRVACDVLYPDGTQERIVSVPKWDFNWHAVYRFVQPKELPAGTQLSCEGAWDNSFKNPVNPDPYRNVRYGQASVDEMFQILLGYTRMDKSIAGGVLK
jgi:peroxiredoxin